MSTAWRRCLRLIPHDEEPAIQLTFADGHIEVVDAATSYRAEGDEFVLERDGTVIERRIRAGIVIVRTLGIPA
jgi:hypothetical protein